MRSAVPVFQLYRFHGENGLWWRLISPNGRGLARSLAPFESADDARASLAVLVEHVEGLELGVRLTPEYRWHWTLRLGADALAEGIGDQDRRVRCTDAGHKFQMLAPVAVVEPEVAVFRRVVRLPRDARTVRVRAADGSAS